MVRNIARIIWHGTAAVFIMTICTFFLWGFIGYIVFDKVSLGGRFGLAVVATLAASVCIVFFTALSIIRSSGQWVEQFNSWSRRNASRLSIGVPAILLLIPGLFLSPYACESLSRAADAESAQQVFELEGISSIEPGSMEYTLAEFERSRRRLEGIWPLPEDTPPISLHFFRDISEYHSTIGSEWSAGLLWCQETRATIFVPLEEVPDIFSEDEESDTPLHEMVHAMICQSIGKQAFRSIPSWFHEGIAQFHEYGSFFRFSARVNNRISVWFKRQELMNPNRFCSYIPHDDYAEISLFYATAWEFVRSLAVGRGIDALNAVVADVGSGMAFEDSLRNHFGGTCIDLYSEWFHSL